jgi:predicted nucleic acid-binding protein
MSGDFIDTNVFIYLVDETAPIKRQRAQELILDALAFHTGNISFQVVQEALHVLTQRLAVPVRPEDAVAFFDRFLVPVLVQYDFWLTV